MPATAQEIYIQVIRTLSPTERLRLATPILNELSQQNISVVEPSDTWTEEDCLDLTTFSLQYAATLFAESEEIPPVQVSTRDSTMPQTRPATRFCP